MTHIEAVVLILAWIGAGAFVMEWLVRSQSEHASTYIILASLVYFGVPTILAVALWP